MAATTATSKVSPVVLGSGRMKSTTYIATKVTGPIKDAAGSNTFATEIVQYDDAKGGGAKTIGTRDAATGEITWNDNASNRTKPGYPTLGPKPNTCTLKYIKSGIVVVSM